MARAASRSGPSIGHQGLCQLDLQHSECWSFRVGCIELTEADTGILLTDVIALVIGEEHVRGKTTLGSIGV